MTTSAELRKIGSTSVRSLDPNDVVNHAADRVRRLVMNRPGEMPVHTVDGRWVGENAWGPSWTGGFLAGLMWILAKRTGDEWWRAKAKEYSALLETRRLDRSTHDLGFIFDPSWGRWCDEEDNDDVRSVLIDAGCTMAGRMVESGGYLHTWIDPSSTFIDVMMNVGIIFRAARYTQDSALHRHALAHCRTSRRFLVRGDGSTVHEGWFDSATGEFMNASTHQGWRSDSSWARGQGWAVYGFATAYAYSGDVEMLETARHVADYYIARTPGGVIPPNDWFDPDPAVPWETSAAAVAAAGLLRLAAAIEDDPKAASAYAEHAERTILALCTTEFVDVDDPSWEGILKHATYHERLHLGVDESVMWGDYYLIEAIDLLDEWKARTR